MSRICPGTGDVVLYLDCLECDDKVCLRTGKKEEEKKESEKCDDN